MIGTLPRSRSALHVEAVGVGQTEIEEDDVVGLLVPQGGAARGDPGHLEAVTQQSSPQGLGDRFIVFHQQYAHRRTIVLEV